MEKIKIVIVDDHLLFSQSLSYLIGTFKEFTVIGSYSNGKEFTNIFLNEFQIKKIAIHHVEGLLKIGDVPVIIAVSSAHRNAAFEACQFAIDTLKETVPIWKKEYFEDGEVWVNPHP